MKKILYILLFLFFTSSVALAQNDHGKIQERMREYVKDRLNLSKAEAERFTPVFMRYFREFAQTHKQNKGDRLILQQKIVELRLRYRDEFRQIMEEQKANQVYKHEDEFRRGVREIILENKRDNKIQRRQQSVLD